VECLAIVSLQEYSFQNGFDQKNPFLVFCQKNDNASWKEQSEQRSINGVVITNNKKVGG
jgi:hypothetical protein